MNKLIVEIAQYGNCLVGKVVHMDKSLRGEGCLNDGQESTTYLITSDGSPEMDDDGLCVRGNNTEDDDNAFCYPYNSFDEAYEALVDLKEAVAYVNGITPDSSENVLKFERIGE